jgi:hypothetical protein
LFQLTHEPPSILTHQESSFPVGHKTRANTLYVPLWPTLNEKFANPALLVGALLVLLLPDWMARYRPSDALPSEGVFHSEPSDPHSASSHTDVPVEQRLLAVKPVPVGAVVEVVILTLSS